MAGRPSQHLPHAPNRIRQVREAKGLTLKQVAKAAGFSEQVVQRYETGENKIRVWQLERIARALRVPAHSLINDFEPGSDEHERTLLAIFRRMRPADRQRALGVLVALEDHEARTG